MISTKPRGITVVATLSLVIFLLGLLGVMIISASQLNKYIKENLQISVFFDANLQDDEAQILSDSILGLPFANVGTFISSEEAVFNFKNEIGEDFVEILGDNPLPASTQISLNKDFTDEGTLLRLERELTRNSGVHEVTYPQSVFQQIDKNRRVITLWLMVLSIILIVIAVVLMSNTIRILIYSDRFLIRNQQLIGATEKFIMKPYKRKGILWTLISFVIGVLLLIGMIWMIFGWLNMSMDLNMSAIGLHFTENWYQYILMLFLLLVGGAAVIYMSTHFATRKYLQIDSDKLYN
jgi:cell division transport system permease protein